MTTGGFRMRPAPAWWWPRWPRPARCTLSPTDARRRQGVTWRNNHRRRSDWRLPRACPKYDRADGESRIPSPFSRRRLPVRLHGAPTGPVYASRREDPLPPRIFRSNRTARATSLSSGDRGASVDGLVIVLWPAPPVDAAKVGGPACSISGRLLNRFGDPLAGGVSVAAPGQDAAAIDSRAWHSSPTATFGRYA